MLHTLFLMSVAPETVNNLELRQCLSNFFPLYSWSKAENQRRMQQVSAAPNSPSTVPIQ